jgi:UDP-glucuronate decarboxylase
MIKGKNILIAGGAGFIGTNLFLRWIKDNKITIIDNLSSSKEKYEIWDKCKNWSFVNGDICKDIDMVQNKYDVIVNLACMASPKWYQSDPVATMDTCYIGTKNLLNLMDKNTVFLQASTSEIYGDPEISPQKEDYRGNTNCFGPRACYDEGKRIAETLCYEKLMQGYKVNVVRIFNTYGPWMDPEDGRVISNILMQVIKREPITIYGDGSQTRSFQYIDDLLDGFEAVIEKDYGFPINIGNPDEFTIKELVDIVIKKWGYEDYPITYEPLPINDPKQRCPDITLANELLGFSPKVKLNEGLEYTYKYFNSL